MAKDYAKAFYKSAAWYRVRDYCLRRDAYLCQDCLANGKYVPAREVHHITELTPDNIHDPSISLNPANLICLCRDCHQQRHRHKQECRYTVDEFGRVKIK